MRRFLATTKMVRAGSLVRINIKATAAGSYVIMCASDHTDGEFVWYLPPDAVEAARVGGGYRMAPAMQGNITPATPEVRISFTAIEAMRFAVAQETAGDQLATIKARINVRGPTSVRIREWLCGIRWPRFARSHQA